MPHDLPKAYEPGAIEARWAEYWVSEKIFTVPSGAAKAAFSMLLPPPNVTGNLHMGHMLNHSEMDILARWRRMSGDLTLWVPGTDHASIATQMMVERQLAAEGKNRRELGREAFVERVWQWKRHYGGVIQQQMKRLGESVDWQREYFTMDESLSRAVREAFVRLHEEGLVYRGKYIVNWCPRCTTAISDLEVKHEEITGKLYEIRYPLSGAEGSIVVATTRPETMLGDTAVAVNPNDERYRDVIGRMAVLPLVGREIPVIADEWANPEFGTGAVKVTPAHDANDFQIGVRHQLPSIDIFDDNARMNPNAGAYAGLDRFKAREKVLEDLEAQGLLVAVKDHPMAVAKCDRCATVIEPRFSTQWFVKVDSMAQRALQASSGGEIHFTPDIYKKIFEDWMANLHDWCVSRQLWWGHPIPAWHCAALGCEHITVARATPAACEKCGSGDLHQETDVLDTWFSAGLLPFTVFGWPDHTPDLDAFYPTSLLVTGFDILFFWVARMVMLGCHFMQDHPQGSVPFREVYIHALVRDAERQKMSKTKGNVLDPIAVIEKYGTDAVRFTLAAMASPGTDIAFSESRTGGYRAFANKIWNAARFIFMNVDRAQQEGVWSLADFAGATRNGIADYQIPATAPLEDRWIVSRFHRASQKVNEAFAEYRFHEAAQIIYAFFWNEFCDWYIEIVKLRLGGPDGTPDRQAAAGAYACLLHVFEGALRLLSPLMPFITEEIWHAIYDGQPPQKSVALAAYPRANSQQFDAAAEEEMRGLQELIENIRNLRAEAGVEPREQVPAEIFAAPGHGFQQTLETNQLLVRKLAAVSAINFLPGALSGTESSRSTSQFDVRIIFERKVDLGAERDRLTKELKKMEVELNNGHRQLANEQFLAKAPAAVVEGLRNRAAELELLMEKARQALQRLGE